LTQAKEINACLALIARSANSAAPYLTTHNNILTGLIVGKAWPHGSEESGTHCWCAN
jgi:hypothetical protein